MEKFWTVEILDPLRIELHDTDTRIQAVLVEPLRFTAWISGSDADYFWRSIEIPAGFSTDLASIPRPLWAIPGFSPFDRIARPAVVHDWLYTNGARAGYTRADADAILEAAMRADGESWFVRRSVWLAVRAFAGSHWSE